MSFSVYNVKTNEFVRTLKRCDEVLYNMYYTILYTPESNLTSSVEFITDREFERCERARPWCVSGYNNDKLFLWKNLKRDRDMEVCALEYDENGTLLNESRVNVTFYRKKRFC